MRTLAQVILIAFILFGNNATAQKQWLPLGTVNFSPGICNYTSIAIDTGGVPYLAFLDGTKGGKMSVMKFTGTNWVMVGTAGFSGFIVNNTSIAFDKNNTPYVAYQDQSASAKAAVMKFDGTNWVAVGTIGFSAGQAMYISIAFDNNNVPHVSYQDMPNSQKVTVMKFNGTSWVPVGSTAFTGGQSAYVSLAFDNNTPYVAYKDASNSYKASVMKYNGSSWVTVGGAGLSPGQADYTSLAIYNGTPYLLYQDGSSNQKANVVKYNGTSWVTVGSAGFSGGYAGENDLAIDNSGTPYVVYRDGNAGGKTTVMKFDGTNWVLVGNAGFSAGTLYYPCIAIDKNGAPYVGYMDWDSGQGTTVMGFGCPAQATTVNICAAVTDSATGKNIIVWDSSAIPHVDSYKIYRDNSGYVLIGTVPGTVHSFTDATATPASQSYKYKLVVLDSCGRQTITDSSIMHQTVRLVFNNITAGIASITWNSYSGIPNLVYTIKRSRNGGPFTNIASFGIAGTDTTYLDAPIPIGNNTYRIDAALANPCTAGGVSFDRIMSNTVTANYVGISDVVGRDHITLIPNPAYKEIKLTSAETIEHVDVFNITGQKISTQKGDGKKETVIDVSLFPQGMYLLKVNDKYNTKFIKQ